MTNFKKFIKNLLADEEGATAIEYALMVAMVAIVIVTLMPGMSAALTNIFGKIQDALNP
jgi:pilus assembly protein Flp/PilA